MGPLVQINGKLNGEKDQENNIISGTSLIAKDIVAISQFNFIPMIGIIVGFHCVRLNAFDQYGVNKMLGNLKEKI